MHSSTPGAAQAPHQPNESITVGTTSYWWCLHGERAGHYVVCPNDPTAPMSLAVCDDFGALVPVRSHGAHEGFAGWLA